MRRCQNSRSRCNDAPDALVGAASAASFSARRRGRSPDPRPADATHRSVHTLAAGLLREPPLPARGRPTDRKSTRLELQSLMRISYAVFCLKKKNKTTTTTTINTATLNDD